MIKVKRIMTRDVLTISKEASLYDAQKIIATKNVSGIVVVEKGLPIGVIDQREIIQGIVGRKTKVRDVMGMEFVVISPLTRFSELTSYIKKQKIKRFAVVEEGRLIGLITESDIIESLRDFTRFDQTVQEVILVIFGLATAFFLFYFSPISSHFFV